MNLKRLKQAEAEFLARYPGGFNHPDMITIGKKHNVGKMTEQAKELLSKKSFQKTGPVLDSLIKIVSRSSMVSMFEKPKFRDYVNGLDRDEREALAMGFQLLLHGKQQRGFDIIIDILARGKLAKWSLVTICPTYIKPLDEVFVKPTTAKNVIKYLELENLDYKPRPSWAFYEEFRRQILAMKEKVDPSISPSNAAFTGFLMMSLGDHQI
ncbi:hypothetical protein OAR36_07835 [Pseudomonadales bacterium]|jgi:hypothetical protein|nr:hypothetical protein [Pseudomonadales bacterium]MDC1018349.1 hypothetical protein [Pseudomonadales bacterium]